MSSFDLNSLSGVAAAQETGIDVPIAHPKTGDPLGIVVKVAGPDSDKQKAGRAAVIEDRIAKNVRKITVKRLDDEANLTAAHSVISWSGVVNEGKTIEFSVAAAVKLFEQYPWLREQVQGVADNRANFIKT
jgi:hypothetical protein